jgi:hypothetical protein
MHGFGCFVGLFRAKVMNLGQSTDQQGAEYSCLIRKVVREALDQDQNDLHVPKFMIGKTG